MYPDLSKSSWYKITALLKIFSEKDNGESRYLIEIGTSLIIDVEWLD